MAGGMFEIYAEHIQILAPVSPNGSLTDAAAARREERACSPVLNGPLARLVARSLAPTVVKCRRCLRAPYLLSRLTCIFAVAAHLVVVHLHPSLHWFSHRVDPSTTTRLLC